MQEWRVSVLCSDWLQSVLLGKYRAAGARVCTSPHTQRSSHSLFVNSHYPHVEARTGNSECRKNVNTPRNIKTLKYSICSHVQGKGTTNLLVVFFLLTFFWLSRSVYTIQRPKICFFTGYRNFLKLSSLSNLLRNVGRNLFSPTMSRIIFVIKTDLKRIWGLVKSLIYHWWSQCLWGLQQENQARPPCVDVG